MSERVEYRAVFRHPECYGLNGSLYRPADTYGKPVGTREEAERQYPERGEETHAWKVGIQFRTVTDWR